MPIIIDTNRVCDFLDQRAGHANEIIIRTSKGKMRVAFDGEIKKENRCKKFLAMVAEWKRAGRLIETTSAALKKVELDVSGADFKSNDAHVIIIARALNVRLLYTDDNDLATDFKNPNLVRPRGSVVRTSTPHRDACKLFDALGS
jgi:predicted nucleic acid-binding protein